MKVRVLLGVPKTMHHLKGQIRRCIVLTAIRDMQQKSCWLEIGDKFVVVDIEPIDFSYLSLAHWLAKIVHQGQFYYLRLDDYEGWSEYICG